MEKQDSAICYFARWGGACAALDGITCRGVNLNCKFYKTEKQYIAEQDRAIDICRQKRICGKCKYHPIPCRKSTEIGKKK